MLLNSLLDCLQSELRLVKAFVATLHDEAKTLLHRGSPQELSANAAHKEKLAGELSTLSALRDKILHGIGHQPGYTGTACAVEHAPELSAVWQELIQQIEVARELNERNGLLIRTHLRFSHEALAALRAANGADLYQRNGTRAPMQFGASRRA